MPTGAFNIDNANQAGLLGAPPGPQASSNFAATLVLISDPNWHLNSDATNHVVSTGDNLAQQTDFNGSNKLFVGNGEGLDIIGIGTTFFPSLICPSYNLLLKGVLIVPSITKNLLSISKFTLDNNVVVEFTNLTISLRTKRWEWWFSKELLKMVCTSYNFPITNFL